MFINKNVMISGGSSGIGLALAKQFYSLGSSVTIIARRKNLLNSAKSIIEKKRVNSEQSIHLISADVSDYSQLKTKLEIPRPHTDILINSAGITYPGKFADLNIDVFYDVMNVNYFGTINLTKLIAPEMIGKRSGYIVNISSGAALIGIYGYTAYAPSKYAVHGFSRCLRAELKSKGIDVSVVFPPDTDTPQLAFEQTLLPDITRQINKTASVMDPEKVAYEIIKGMKRKKFTIIPGFGNRILAQFTPILDSYFYHYAVRKDQ